MPVYSVIVPVYKTEAYLEKCINSILSQTFRDFELILVDDGSPDRCPEICDRMAQTDARIRVIHQKNGGVSSARNAGIAAAEGEFIWFVDSDDYIDPSALEELYTCQKARAADLYVFNCGAVRTVFTGSFDEFLRNFYFSYTVGFGPCNKIYRRSVIEAGGVRFDAQETIGEDLLFNMAYYHALVRDKGDMAVSFVGRDYYHYIIRESSAMTTASKGRIVQQMRLFDKIETMLAGQISRDNMDYLYLLHLITGILQASQGGLTRREFAAAVDYDKNSERFSRLGGICKDFFENEHSSFFGRTRLRLFIKLMRSRRYVLAGLLMGLK